MLRQVSVLLLGYLLALTVVIAGLSTGPLPRSAGAACIVPVHPPAVRPAASAACVAIDAPEETGPPGLTLYGP